MEKQNVTLSIPRLLLKQAKILAAEGESEAIRLVNEAANKYFIGNAQLLRRLEALERSLSKNAKIVVPLGSELVNVIGEMAGYVPVNRRPQKDTRKGNGRGQIPSKVL